MVLATLLAVPPCVFTSGNVLSADFSVTFCHFCLLKICSFGEVKRFMATLTAQLFNVSKWILLDMKFLDLSARSGQQ